MLPALRPRMSARRRGVAMIARLFGKFGMAFAVLAALSLVISPVAPALAANGVAPAAITHAQAKAKIVHHAERGEAAILTKAQMDRLARANPSLHRKVMVAYRTNTIPQVTAAEKRLLGRMTSRNLESFKAGTLAVAAAAGPPAIVVAFLIIVLLLLVLYAISGGRVDAFGLIDLIWSR
jgi:hypothetical protein